MSIEIREIVVRANITRQDNQREESRKVADDRKAIVEECTRRVLGKLRKRSPR
ncbi:MAG: DUF5908 family protein [Bacteroidia bacterium]